MAYYFGRYLTPMESTQIDIDAAVADFPYDEPREGQLEAIQKAIKAFNAGKKVVIIEGPTGCGKSVIAHTIAQSFKSAFYLTSTKILQDQLLNDFGTELSKRGFNTEDIKGRANYECTFWDVVNSVPNANQIEPDIPSRPKVGRINCNQGACKMRGDSRCKICFPHGQPSLCEYYKQLSKAQAAHTCVMNFSSFLYQTRFTMNFGRRDLLIIDECHNTEPQLMDFVSLTLNDALFLPDLKFPKFNTAAEYAIWLQNSDMKELIEQKIKLALYSNRLRDVEDWKNILFKYEQFIAADSSEWVVTYKEIKNGAARIIELKPIFVRDYAQKYIFNYGEKILLMSATVLSPNDMADALGLAKEDIYAYRMKSRFPPENRQIKLCNVGSLSYKNKAATMPALVDKVTEIARKHKGQRGIIHTHNFEIAEKIKWGVPPDVQKRIHYQKDFYNKNEMLDSHAERDDSIIVAPAMHEGLDLKDDLARFQIICKVPYPALGDNKQLKARMEKSPTYYDWLTALKLVQSYGRSIRSEDDYAITYILDSDINWFLKKAKKMIPVWFSEAIG